MIGKLVITSILPGIISSFSLYFMSFSSCISMIQPYLFLSYTCVPKFSRYTGTVTAFYNVIIVVDRSSESIVHVEPFILVYTIILSLY